MDYELKTNGEFTLQQTEEACEDKQLGGWKFDSITTDSMFNGKDVKLMNKAAFDRSNSSAILTNLQFRELGTDNSDSVIQQMKNLGWIFICDSHIYVENDHKRVLVFGKN
jgi:hypothetical protein